MAINDRTEKKHKSIAFVSNTCNEQAQSDLETNEEISNDMVLLGRQITIILKKVGRRRGPNVKNISLDINSESQRKDRNVDETNQEKSVQCHGCEGFGFRTECPTYLKRQKKGLSVSWSDDDEPDNENSNHVTALTRRYESDD